MSLVSYSSCSVSSVTDLCGICLDILTKKKTVAHNDQTDSRSQCHIHKKCLIVWLSNHDACPICRARVDFSSVFPWKNRVIYQIKRGVLAAAKEAMRLGEIAAMGIMIGSIIVTLNELCEKDRVELLHDFLLVDSTG